MSLFDKFSRIAGQYTSLKTRAEHDPFSVVMDEIRGPARAVIKGKETVLAGTNNYLGLTCEPAVIDAACTALREQGAGTTGSRSANGTYAGHRKLEQDLAAFLEMKSCIVFSTGYQVNLGAVSALASPPDDAILIDADCHACIYDGCRLSGAKTVRFHHNSPESLDRRLSRLDPGVKGKLVCIEGMYSMYGDTAPVKELLDVARTHKALLLVDEAHSFGVYGERGRGVCEAAGVLDQIDFYTGTFSKSLASTGGFIVSRHPELEYLRLASRPYVFTASPSPANIAAATAGLDILVRNDEARRTLWSRAGPVHDAFSRLGFTLCADPGPVIAVRMETREQAVTAWNFLMNNGVYVNLAIPPGTPDASSILRLSVSAAHTPRDIRIIIDAYTALAATIGLPAS